MINLKTAKERSASSYRRPLLGRADKIISKY